MPRGVAIQCIQGERKCLFYYFKHNFADFQPALYCYSVCNICKWTVFICSLCYLDREIHLFVSKRKCVELWKSNVWTVEFWFETLIYLYVQFTVDRNLHGQDVYQNEASAKYIILVSYLEAGAFISNLICKMIRYLLVRFILVSTDITGNWNSQGNIVCRLSQEWVWWV